MHSNRNQELTVHIHLQDIASKKLFLDLESTTVERDQYFQVQLINRYELFVDSLFEKYPIYTSDQETSPVNLLIIGFGPLGQQIALKAVTQSEQFERSKPYITANDIYIPIINQYCERVY